MAKSFLHTTIIYSMLSFSHFKGIIKIYTSIHHGITQGMYNHHFCNGFTINSSQLIDYEDLTFWFSCNRSEITIRSSIQSLVRHSIQHSIRHSIQHSISLGAHRSWWLAHRRPLMDESGYGFYAHSCPPAMELDASRIG
jgi:hypothetical protein